MNQLDRELGMIETWLGDTTEEFDDWDWDGEELVIFLNGKAIERYTRNDLIQSMPGFPNKPE